MKTYRVCDIAKDWLAKHPNIDGKARTEALEEIVRPWLEKHGYNGLAGIECGCGRGNLMPCESPKLECVAGHWDEKQGIYLPGKIPRRKR